MVGPQGNLEATIVNPEGPISETNPMQVNDSDIGTITDAPVIDPDADATVIALMKGHNQLLDDVISNLEAGGGGGSATPIVWDVVIPTAADGITIDTSGLNQNIYVNRPIMGSLNDLNDGNEVLVMANDEFVSGLHLGSIIRLNNINKAPDYYVSRLSPGAEPDTTEIYFYPPYSGPTLTSGFNIFFGGFVLRQDVSVKLAATDSGLDFDAEGGLKTTGMTGPSNVYYSLEEDVGPVFTTLIPDGAFVVKDDTEYKMYYAGHDFTSINLATSPDGKVWTPYTSNPIITDAQYHCSVNYFADGFVGANAGSDPSAATMYYRMWYQGLNSNQIGELRYTESVDGIVWHNHMACTEDALKPVFDINIIYTGNINPDQNPGHWQYR